MADTTLSGLDRARMAAALGDLAGLREVLLTLALQDPPTVLLAQAQLLLDQGRAPEAAGLLAALERLPHASTGAGLLVRCRALIAQDQPMDALLLLRSALSERASAEPDLLVEMARAMLHADQLDAAQRVLDAVLDARPGHFEARLGRGALRLAQGRINDAIPELRAAQRLNPTRREPYIALGRAWRLLGEPAAGAALLEDLLARHAFARAPEAMMELVRLHDASGDVHGVTRWLREVESAARLDPANRLELARYWFPLGRPGEMRRLLIGLGEAPGERTAALALAGMAAELDGDPRRAFTYYSASVQIQPDLWPVQVQLVGLLLDAGSPRESIEPHLAAASAADPSAEEVRLVTARCALAWGIFLEESLKTLLFLYSHGGTRAWVRAQAGRLLGEAG